MPTDVGYIGGRGLRRWFWNNTWSSFEDLASVEPTTLDVWLEPEGYHNL